MVSRKTNQCKALKNTTAGSQQKGTTHHGAMVRSTLKIAGLVTLLSFVALMVFLILSTSRFNNQSASKDSENTEVDEVSGSGPTIEPEKLEVAKIDFQPVIDNWVTSIGGNKSVVIYDVERDEVVGEYNANESYNTASLYKLFVVYEGYRRVESHEWDGTAKAGSTGYTILECLDLSIRQSYSPCAETLWGMIGRAELDDIIAKDFGIIDSDISSLVSNPMDVLSIMKIFYEHNEIKDETIVSQIKDSFLKQPVAANGYNWRQGLPSGFTVANVYNKVGWDYNPDGAYWNVYHDAAVVEYPELNRHFVVVVMTNKVPFQKIRQLGSEIEKLIVG